MEEVIQYSKDPLSAILKSKKTWQLIALLFCAGRTHLRDWQYLVGLQMVTTCKLYKSACSPTSVAQINYASIPCTASQVNRGAGRGQMQSFCSIAHSAGYSQTCLYVVHAHPFSGHFRFLKEIYKPNLHKLCLTFGGSSSAAYVLPISVPAAQCMC